MVDAEINSGIRKRIAAAAKSYEGAPFVSIPGQFTTIQVGLTRDRGFNCSGFAIRSILDGFGAKVDAWDPQARTVDAMFRLSLGADVEERHLTDDMFAAVNAGDLIGWKNSGSNSTSMGHCAIALSGVGSDGAVPYMHATRYYIGGRKGDGEVEAGKLLPGDYLKLYHLPLGRLVQVALRMDV